MNKYFFTVLLIFVSSVFIACEANDYAVYWKDVKTPSEAFLNDIEPVGKDGDNYHFLCQVIIPQNFRFAGRLEIRGKNSHCSVAHGATVVNSTMFNILVAPRGTTSWVPFISSDNMTGVSIPQSRTLPVCRVTHNNDALIVGSFSAWPDVEKICRYVHNGNVEVRRSDFEILVVNSFRVANGIQSL